MYADSTFEERRWSTPGGSAEVALQVITVDRASLPKPIGRFQHSRLIMSRPVPTKKESFANGGGRLNLANTSLHLPADQQRHHHEQSTTPQSPCFIHSKLDRSYFDSVGTSLSNGQESSNSTAKQSIASTSHPTTSNHSTRHAQDKNRREPRHRGAQGAVEPESESEEESGSDASTDKNGSNASYSGSGSESSEDESDRVRSLTRQLAETAVGVREMSKQLGECRRQHTMARRC